MECSQYALQASGKGIHIANFTPLCDVEGKRQPHDNHSNPGILMGKLNNKTAGSSQPSEPRAPRLLWQLLTATFFRIVLNTARRFVYPFAPALSRDLQVPLMAITSLIAINQASSLTGLFIGPLTDRWGYRNMMRTGLALLSVGMLLCWIAPVYGFVFIGLMLAGAGKTAFDPAVQAFIGQRVPFARRGMAVGTIETAWAGSTLIGIPTVALIINSYGLKWSFFAMAVVGALGWIMLGKVIPADGPSKDRHTPSMGLKASLLQLVRIRSAAGMMGFGFLLSLANDNVFVIYGAWLEQDFNIGIVALGLSTGIIGAAELTGESLTVFLGDRIGLKRAMIIGSGIATLGYLLLPLLDFSLYASLGGLFIIFLAFEFTIVCSFSLGTELLPSARATMMAGYYAAAGIGRMLGAFAGGALWVTGGLTAVTTTSAIAMAMAICCILWGLRGWSASKDAGS